MELGLGPDPRILALSEFGEAPGPGVVLVDLNGQGMLLTMPVVLDAAGHVVAGGSHISGTGECLWEGTVTVTGRASGPVAVIEVVVTSPVTATRSPSRSCPVQKRGTPAVGRYR